VIADLQKTRDDSLYLARQFVSAEEVALLLCAVSILDMMFQPQHTEALKKCLGKPRISYRNPESILKWSSNVMIPAYWDMETSNALHGYQI
jgi:hypothetical protein